MEQEKARGTEMSIKKSIIQYIEQRPMILNAVLKLTNKISAPKKSIEINSIHFKDNEVSILGKQSNRVVLEKSSYIKNSKIWIKGENNTIEVSNEVTLLGDSISQMFHVDGNNNRIIIGKNCRINQTTFFIWGSHNTIIL